MSSVSTSKTHSSATLAILAGSGALPELLVAACIEQGRDFIIIAFKGETDPVLAESHPHAWVSLQDANGVLNAIKASGASQVVMAGKIERPNLTELRPSLTTAKLAGKVAASVVAGDDALFSAIVSIFEEAGFEVVGVDSIVEGLLTPEGLLTQAEPSDQDKKDIEQGIRLAHEIGRFDIGQAVIVKQGQVLGVEAVEGTDALIARSGTYDIPGDGGVLVKAKKPAQEKRVDLPTIGVSTVENIAAAGFSGIAIEAQGTLMVQREAILALANEKKIFIFGFSA